MTQPQPQYLYRIAWFSDDEASDTIEIGLVYAANDEEAMSLLPDHWEAGAYPGNGWADDAFFTCERLEDEERLAEIIENWEAQLGEVTDSLGTPALFPQTRAERLALLNRHVR